MGTAHIDEGLATFYRYGPYLDHEAVDAVDDLVDTGDYEFEDEFVKVRIDAITMRVRIPG